MTEDLIRNVVQQVLSQMGNGAIPANGKAAPSSAGNLGVFPTVDTAVEAAEAAFKEFSKRSLDDRKKAVECIRKICVEPGPGAGPGRARGNQDRPRRSQDRQARTNHSPHPGRRVPAYRPRQRRPWAHADRLRPLRRHRRDHAGHAQPAHAGGQRHQHAGRGQHGRLQRPSLGRKHRRRGRAPVQQGHSRGDRPGEPAHHHRPAHAQDRRSAFRQPYDQAPGRHRRPGRGPRGARQQAASDRRRPRQPARRR